MRTAIIALTQTGANLALRMAKAIDEVQVYLPEKFAAKHKQVHSFGKLSILTRDVFAHYDALVFIMAAGIVVRTIVPLIKSKLQDPAVIVFDERGKHGISLLSGHVGGANLWTKILCRAVEASPVITTATDTEGFIAPDLIAGTIGLFPYPHAAILEINSALLDKKPIAYGILNRTPFADSYAAYFAKYGISLEHVETTKDWQADTPRVLILPRDAIPPIQATRQNTLYLVPKKLIAGIGCKKDTTHDEILAALNQTCATIGFAPARIDAFASTTAKQTEQGLLLAIESLGRKISFFGNDVMQEVIQAYHLEESPFVKKTLGIGNVCEAAALCLAKDTGGRFALQKTKYKKVTVALLWQKLQ